MDIVDLRHELVNAKSFEVFNALVEGEDLLTDEEANYAIKNLTKVTFFSEKFGTFQCYIKNECLGR